MRTKNRRPSSNSPWATDGLIGGGMLLPRCFRFCLCSRRLLKMRSIRSRSNHNRIALPCTQAKTRSCMQTAAWFPPIGEKARSKTGRCSASRVPGPPPPATNGRGIFFARSLEIMFWLLQVGQSDQPARRALALRAEAGLLQLCLRDTRVLRCRQMGGGHEPAQGKLRA